MWAHVSVAGTAYQRESVQKSPTVLCACFTALSAKCVSSFKVAFIQGRELPNKRTCICIRCMLSAGEGAVKKKKDVRGGQRERAQILHCGVGGRKGLSELGSGWKLTEKDFRLVPCGDKSLGISPWMQPENGREEQHAELRGLFLLTMKRKFVFPKSHPTFLLHATNIPKCWWNLIRLALHESTLVARLLIPFCLICFFPNQFHCVFY